MEIKAGDLYLTKKNEIVEMVNYATDINYIKIRMHSRFYIISTWYITHFCTKITSTTAKALFSSTT